MLKSVHKHMQKLWVMEQRKALVTWKCHEKSFDLFTIIGGFKHFYFHPYLGKIPILTHIFSDGLVQPPTSSYFLHFPGVFELFFVFFCSKVLS